jgi:hypothetical protein
MPMRGQRLWVTLGLYLASASTLLAQPSVPPRGEGTVSLTYQNYYVTGHFDLQGKKNKNGGTHTKALLAEIDFGVTDSIGLTVRLPFVASKYTGGAMYLVRNIPTSPGPLDDGKYHGAFQDLHVEARRVWWAGRVAFAPMIGVTLPTHAYATHGEAVPGRRRRELQFGASVGADLHRLVPRTAVSARYALATAERQHGFPSVRSNLDVDADYALSRLIGLRGLASWQFAHKGPTIDELHAFDWLQHDRFIVSSYANVGGGLTLSIRRDTNLHALWIATVSGKGGAHVARTLAVGATWSFGAGMGALPFPMEDASETKKAVRRARFR